MALPDTMVLIATTTASSTPADAATGWLKNFMRSSFGDYDLYCLYRLRQLQDFKRGLRQLDVDVDDLVFADIGADIRVLGEDVAQLLLGYAFHGQDATQAALLGTGEQESAVGDIFFDPIQMGFVVRLDVGRAFAITEVQQVHGDSLVGAPAVHGQRPARVG